MPDESRLTILRRDPEINNHLIVKCECGSIRSMRKDKVIYKRTLSCGCLNREKIKETITTHNLSNTSEYCSWAHMIQRCTNKNNDRYYDYGGRGITVCKEWKNSFSSFIKDMGMKPFKGAQIERTDNSKGYYLNNCKWASRKQNQRNMRSTVFITYKKITKLLIEYSEEFGIDCGTLRSRIWRGWTIERALETPVEKRKKNE